MENIKLAIITRNEDYGRALSFGLVGVYRNFDVTLYKAEHCSTFSSEKYDLVLWDMEEALPEKGILMAEKPSMARVDPEEGIFSIYKYDNVRVLAGQMLLIYSLWTGRKVVRLQNEDMNLLVFAAAEGGVGCTSVALAAAQELSRFHKKKVLYLSLEEIESTFQYMHLFPQGKGISEYLYFLFSEQGENNGGPFLESFLVTDDFGVEAFSPSAGKNLLTGLSPEEMQYFISTLINTGRYDYILIDAGCRLDNSVLCCYEMANRIYFVSRTGELLGKEVRHLEYLMFLKGEKLIEKMWKIENFYNEAGGSIRNEKKDAMIQTAVVLQEDKFSFRAEGDQKKISLDGPFGMGISRLTGKILNKALI